MEAQAMVRRAEQGIGQAVRNGQEAGTVARKGDNRERRGGRGGFRDVSDENISKSSPAEYFPGGGGAQSDSYAMADATDEQFEDAIGPPRIC